VRSTLTRICCTWAGAQTQQILVSVLRTCWQQGKDAFARLVGLLRSLSTETLDIVPGQQLIQHCLGRNQFSR